MAQIVASSYTIRFRTYQTNTSAFFVTTERGVFHYANGGTWSETDGVMTLTMGGSGTSGMLRYRSEDGREAFWVVAGVHNYKPWLDIVTNLADSATVVKSLPEYYQDGERARAREAQRTSWSATNSAGRKIEAKIKDASGDKYDLDVIIN